MKTLRGLICEMLRDYGVKEVILSDKDDNLTIEFATDTERLIMSNSDFNDEGL